MILAEVADKMPTLIGNWSVMLVISVVLVMVALRWWWVCLILLPMAVLWVADTISCALSDDIYSAWVDEIGRANVWAITAADFLPLLCVLIVISVHVSRRWLARRKLSV